MLLQLFLLFQHTHTFTHFKNHQFTFILETLKNTLRNLPLHVPVHIYDHLQGAHEQCFVPLLSWILWMYVRYVLVRYVTLCHYRRLCVYVPGVPVLVKSGHRIQLSNCTKHCSWAPWRWSYIWTKTCRGKFFKVFFKCFKYWCELMIFKVYKRCARVGIREIIEKKNWMLEHIKFLQSVVYVHEIL
jgi:hypothetical protein